MSFELKLKFSQQCWKATCCTGIRIFKQANTCFYSHFCAALPSCETLHGGIHTIT